MKTAKSELDFVHRFVPGANGSTISLLLLHGTGGDEEDLLPLGGMIAPGAALLSPRGKVLENGMPRFFRRIAEGQFDQADLARRTEELNQFLRAATVEYDLTKKRLYAVGFSNGANIASSLLLRYPESLAGAVLIRGMVPFYPTKSPHLDGKPVLLLNGKQDPIVAVAHAERLHSIFADANAKVELHWENSGHGLTQGDLTAARAWLEAQTTQV